MGTCSTNSQDETFESFVCNENEISENEMKQFDVGDIGKILLVKQTGQLSAIGTKCSHYGAPLNTGALSNNRIRCPWHGACFNLQTGDIEDFPGLDSIPCYRVSVENGKIKIQAKKSDIQKNKRIKNMVERNSENDSTFLVIGGGPASAVCVETLRQEGFSGRIVMICKENVLPYDRVKISKSLDIDIKKIEYRTREFYDKYDIEVMNGVEAIDIVTKEKIIKLSNGYAIKYDKIFIATGSSARKPNIPGCDLKNIFTIRNYNDADMINKVLNSNSEVVCLGSSFISLETAAACSKIVKKVTLIGRDKAPLIQSFGIEIGQRIMEMFQENNIDMIMESGIKQFIGNDGIVTAVELIDGRKISCNVCIMGTGSILNTEFLKKSEIDMNENGSINANIYLQTNITDVFVGGDIAHAPLYSNINLCSSIGHIGLAQYHGRIAAINMVGRKFSSNTVPFFWTLLFGKSFRYCGYGKAHKIQIEGSLKDLKFVAFYFDENDNVIAIASCMWDPIVAQFAEFLQQGKRLRKNDIKSDMFGWTKLIKPAV